jgi:hypothetical protein
MGIIKWFNDRWNKPEEAAQEAPKVEPEPVLSDFDRVKNYFASGGKIVDLTNRPRIEGDGFAPDHELLTPFNRAHEGTKAGLNSLVRGKR